MIFSKPIEELNIDDVKTFCDKGIKEGFVLDYKEDFPRNLAKSICAFANTSGGVILIGIKENDEGKPKMPINGIAFEKGLHEKVVNIILDNISPPLFPEINVIKFKKGDDERAIIVIRILQSNETPHAVDGNKAVYIRTDNRNRPEEIATIEQIGWLLNKRKKSEELKQSLYNSVDERLTSIYKLTQEAEIKKMEEERSETIVSTGLYIPKAQGIFSAVPLFPNKPFVSVRELKNFLCLENDLKIKDYFGALYDFPYFDQEPKTTQQSIIDYRSLGDMRGTLFYEFDIYGLFFYQEPFGIFFNKENGSREYGEKIDSVWFYQLLARLDQYLEVVDRFYDKIRFWGLIEIKIRINDIFGLKITKPENFIIGFDGKISHQENFESKKIISKQELKEKRVDILKDIFKEICLTFNFDIEDSTVENYLEERGRL